MHSDWNYQLRGRYLNDVEGGRRFWPVRGALHRREACLGYDTGGSKPDMGGGAVSCDAGEKLILSGGAAEEAVNSRRSHDDRSA